MNSRLTRPALVLLLPALLLACDAPEDGPVNQAETEYLAQLVNDHRVAEGLPSFAWSPDVAGVAQAYCDDMSTQGYFAHDNLDGQSVTDRLVEAGVSFDLAGENMGVGYHSPEPLLSNWLDSPGHRANIESATFTHCGIGYAADGHYWTPDLISLP